MATPGSENAANCCLCPWLGQFCECIQRSTESNAADLVDHLDSCGNWLRAVMDVAVVGPLKDWLIDLSKNGQIQKTAALLRGLLNNHQWTGVLDLCPSGPVRDSLKGLLLMGSVRYSLGDLSLHIVQKEVISDSQLMAAIQFAAHLQDRSAFLQLITACSRSHRVFRQKFAHQYRRENPQSVCGEECRWMYNILYGDGEKDLALFVATSHLHEKSLIVEFCQDEADNFDIKQHKFKFALRKLYDYSVDDYCKFVERLYESSENSESDQSFLFQQAIRWKEYDLVLTLCRIGVSRKDLKFCASWLLLGDADCQTFFLILENLEYENTVLLRVYAIRFSMKQYFKLRSDTSMETLIEQFSCVDSADAPSIFSHLFEKAIDKCVAYNCADCFIRLCMKYCGFERHDGVIEIQYDNWVFACACSTVVTDRPDFIFKLFEYQREGKIDLKATASRNYAKFRLLDFALENKVWNILPCFLPDALEGFHVLEHCIDHMLGDQSTWAGMAPVLDQWIKEKSIMPQKWQVFIQEKFARVSRGHRPFSVSSLMQWCVDEGHPTLAFFLAVVSDSGNGVLVKKDSGHCTLHNGTSPFSSAHSCGVGNCQRRVLSGCCNAENLPNDC